MLNTNNVIHLFDPMPPEIRDGTAFMDRIQAYLPSWDAPKINKELLTIDLSTCPLEYLRELNKS